MQGPLWLTPVTFIPIPQMSLFQPAGRGKNPQVKSLFTLSGSTYCILTLLHTHPYPEPSLMSILTILICFNMEELSLVFYNSSFFLVHASHVIQSPTFLIATKWLFASCHMSLRNELSIDGYFMTSIILNNAIECAIGEKGLPVI